MKRDSIEIDDECHSNANQNEDSQTSELPPLKRFKHLSALVAAKKKEKNEQHKSVCVFQIEIDTHIASPSTQSIKEDPFTYWLQNTSTFSNLSSISLDLLSVSASSTPIERVLFYRKKATTGKGNHLCNETWNEKC